MSKLSEKLQAIEAQLLEMQSQKNNEIEQRMLNYIFNMYGKNGKDILLDAEEKLLPHYVDAYVSKQKLVDNEQGDFHKILRLVDEAGDKFSVNDQKSKFRR